MNVFEIAHRFEDSTWMRLSQLSSASLGDLHAKQRKVPYKRDASCLTRIGTKELEQIQTEHGKLVSSCRSELQKMKTLAKPHMFILTAADGTALYFAGTDSVLNGLDQFMIGRGTSFAIEHAGINAISVAMETRNKVLIKGSEHYLQMFSGWTCVCAPVRYKGSVAGYLDLSFHKDEDEHWAMAFMDKLTEDIESCLRTPSPAPEAMPGLFDRYGLTEREKEIAFRWLQNQCVLRIAEELGLAEGTVRNYTKKLYTKIGVCDKGEFLRKFL